jgi:hypothetical protein
VDLIHRSVKLSDDLSILRVVENLKLLIDSRGTVVASFPRSGSTLTRNIVAAIVREALSADFNLGETTRSALNKEDIIVNLDRHPFVRPKVLERFPLIARTHTAAAVGRVKTVFWFRNPLDCIYSYFHLALRDNPAYEFRKFSNKVSIQWQELSEAAILTHCTQPNLIHLVRYEDYLSSPVPVFGGVASFMRLGEPISVSKAVEQVNASFRNNRSFAPTEAQPSRGTVGAGERLIDSATREHLKSKLMPNYNILTDLLAKQRLAQKATEAQDARDTTDAS